MNNMISKSESITNSQTLTFRDGTEQWKSEPAAASDYTRYMTPNADVSLGNFFERPLLIGTYAWTPGVTPFFQALDPWTLFWGNKRNINRINNFMNLNCRLNVKIIINGNPFYYGRLIANYIPLVGDDIVTDTSGLSTLTVTGASQRLHCYINPTSSQGGELVLPFVYWQNALNIPTAEWTRMGRLNIQEINPLKHANASVTPVTINIFAWATDVVLSIPTSVNTSALVVQASEIDMKPSTLATSAANIASKLSSVPIIGPYAKATEMFMGTLGSVAKMFGYSRPIIIEPPNAMRAVPIGELACTDKKENVVKLTADSRQELTIDSAVIGVDLPDELSIAYIASKESYLTQFPWAIASTEGVLLWNSYVTPYLQQYSAPTVYPTAMSFAGYPFKSWRGTMKFRFQFVCSAYHKGRVVIVYDPSKITAGLELNTMYSRIVDLEKETDVTIDVAWSQPVAYLGASAVTSVNYGTTLLTPALPTTMNGVIGLYVMNSLTSPNSVTNNDISVNVFVSACEDIDFVEPTNTSIQAIQWAAQSDEIEVVNAPTQSETTECISKCIEIPDVHAVFYGERFPSFRALLRRYNFHSSVTSGTAAAGRYLWTLGFPDFPQPRGVVLSGGMNNVGLANYTNTTLLNYLTPAFVAQRGGVRWKYILHEDATPTSSTMTVARNGLSFFTNSLTLRADTTSDLYMKQASNGNQSYAPQGSFATVTQLQPVIEFELPFYRRERFTCAKNPAGRTLNGPTLLTTLGHVVSVNTKLSATTDRSTLDRYVSVAEDFQLHWFQGCPPFIQYAIP